MTIAVGSPTQEFQIVVDIYSLVIYRSCLVAG